RGQFTAGLVQGVEFLLLPDQGGDVAAQDEEQIFSVIWITYGRYVQVEVAAAAAGQARGNDQGGGQGGAKGTGFGADDIRGAEGLVEVAAARRAAAPRLEDRVGPTHTPVGIDHGHAVGQGGEDVLRLHQGAQAAQNGGVGRVGEDGVD